MGSAPLGSFGALYVSDNNSSLAPVSGRLRLDSGTSRERGMYDHSFVGAHGVHFHVRLKCLRACCIQVRAGAQFYIFLFLITLHVN